MFANELEFDIEEPNTEGIGQPNLEQKLQLLVPLCSFILVGLCMGMLLHLVVTMNHLKNLIKDQTDTSNNIRRAIKSLGNFLET